jgi:predicted component of type VI protein secretion system
MKLSLIVLTPGKFEGKEIPISLSQFVVGRDPNCHLRPASALVSKRHCALLVQTDRVILKDFDSTNGTFINDKQIKGEAELHDKDILKVGPVAFGVRIEVPAPVEKPKPVPPKAPEAAGEDDVAAALLLSLQEEEGRASSDGAVDPDGVPTGSTVHESAVPPESEVGYNADALKGGAAREKAAKAASADTSIAARAILEKYLRRPRS